MVQNNKKKFNLTIFIYLFIFFALLLAVMIVSNKVLFRPWTARTFTAAEILNEQVFIFGGLDSVGESRDEIMMIDLEELSLHRECRLPEPLFSPSSAVYKGNIYLAGGISDKQYKQNIYRFDPELETVVLIGKLPGPRAYGSLSACGGSLYYFGGFDGERLRDDIIKVNPQTGETEVAANLSQPLEYHRTVSVGSIIYIIGGENKERQNVSSVAVYSTEDNRLRQLKDLSEPAARFAMAEVKQAQGSDGVIIAEGWGTGSRNSIFHLRFQNGTYTEKKLGIIDESFTDTDMVYYDDFLFLIGGSNPEMKRQIRILRVDPATMQFEDIRLKSFVWQ